MNHASDSICRFCGSSLYARFGRPHCSGDNLRSLQSSFDELLALEVTDPFNFSQRLESVQDNDNLFDLFMVYWNTRKKDPEVNLQCIHKERYYRDLQADPNELPMTDPYIPFPDLAEVYLAEIMLDRKLTDLEKEGSRDIPKISEEGDFYFAPLKWITFPHGYMSLTKLTGEIKDLEPLPKVFDIESIRGKYKK